MKLTRYGQGDVSVILIHGGPSLYGYMSSLGEHLKQDCRVIEYAQRGTYENPAPSDEITIEMHLEDLRRVIEKSSGQQKTVVLGHSWGANLALLFAARFPALVKKIVLLGMAPLHQECDEGFGKNIRDRMTPEIRQEVERIGKLFQEAQDWKTKNELKERHIEIITPLYNFNPQSVRELPASRWNFETFKRSRDSLWELINTGKVEEMLASIRLPAIAFHGEYDPIPIGPTFDFLRKHLKHCELESIPRAGHFIWIEPDAKIQFLEKLKSAIRS